MDKRKIKPSWDDVNDGEEHFKPKKWNANTLYNPETMPVQAIEILSTGISQIAAAAELGITRQCWYNWRKEFPEFNDAVECGLMLGQWQWERLAQHPNHPQFDFKVYDSVMRNVYKAIADNPTILLGTDVDKTNPDKLAELIKAATDKFGV